MAPDKKDTFFAVLIIASLFYFVHILRVKEAEYILEDYSFTEAEILKVYTVDGGAPIVDYRYTINNRIFEFTHSAKSNLFKCLKHQERCDSLRFWVVYSNRDFSKHLVDLTNPIVSEEFPNLDHGIGDFQKRSNPSFNKRKE